MRHNDGKLYDILKEDTMIPSKVERAIQETYTLLENGKVNRKNGTIYAAPKRGFRTAAAIALVTLAIGTTAYATARHSAILDSLSKFDSGKEIPEQAKSLIETDIAQEKAQDGIVSFKVREALCDKNNIIVAVEAKAAEPGNYLIIPAGGMDEKELEQTTMKNLNPSMAEKNMMIADYARKYNKEILSVDVVVDTGADVCSIDFNLEEDGTGVFTYHSDNISKKTVMTLSCQTKVFYNGNIVKDTFDFKVTDSSKENQTVIYRTKNSDAVDGTNLVIDEVKFEKSAIDIKSTITYHYIGNSQKMTEDDEDTTFFFFDQAGNQLKHGAGMAGSCTMKNGIFTQSESLTSVELPEQLTLQVKNAMTKEMFGPVKIYRVDK